MATVQHFPYISIRVLWLSVSRPPLLVRPATAALCGLLAGGALPLDGRRLVLAALLLILCEPLLGAVWVAAVTDWRSLWGMRPDTPVALPALPYTQPGAPADRLRQNAAIFLRHLQARWPQVGTPITSTFGAFIASLLTAFVLGNGVVLPVCVAGAIALSHIRCGPSPHTAIALARWDIGLPWLMGMAAIWPAGTLPWLGLMAAVLFSLAGAALASLWSDRGGYWSLTMIIVSLACMAAGLAIGGYPLQATLVALAGVGAAFLATGMFQVGPHISSSPGGIGAGRGAWYARRVDPLVLAAMLASALA